MDSATAFSPAKWMTRSKEESLKSWSRESASRRSISWKVGFSPAICSILSRTASWLFDRLSRIST